MKTAHFVAIAVLVLAFASTAPASTVKGPSGYTIDVPKGWTIKSAPTAQPEFTITKVVDTTNFLAMNVVAVPAPKGTKLDTIWHGICDGAKDATGFKLLKEAKSAFAGQPAGYCEYTFESGKPARTFWMRQAVLLHADKIITFTCVASAGIASSERQKVLDCANSAKWPDKRTSR